MKKAHMLLVYPDFLESEKNDRGKLGNYSEGLASISAVLKAAGHTVSLYHQTYMPSKSEFMAKIAEFSPDIIGFSMRTTAMPFVVEMAGWLDDDLPETHVTCGGYHPTLVPDEVLAVRGVDSVCIGEGEYPLRELCDAVGNGEIRTDIQSMYFKQKDGTVVKNPVRPMIEDLDELPFPDYELFDFENLRTSRINTAMVMLSRGCLFSCTYCGNSQFRNVYPNKQRYARFRSPENAMKLLKMMLEKYPFIKYFEFRDAIFNMYKDWFYEFIAMYQNEIKLPFNCNLRFDILDENMIKELKKAGCYMIDIGIESGNEEIRSKYLHRHMTNEHMINVSRWFKQNNITTLAYNIVGLPHETLENSLETVKLNAKLEVDKFMANIFYPYPMTKLYDIANEGGFIVEGIDPNDPVQLRMPQYKKSDIMYMAYNFHALVKKYKKIFALPPEIAAKKEAKLDKRILSKLYPRALICKWRLFKTRCFVLAKRTLMKMSPKIYIKLKNRTMKQVTS